MTAEELLSHMQAMPPHEQRMFFTLLGSRCFPDDDFTHKQVFGHLEDDEFTAKEAAEYLEISIATLRRYVQSGKLKPAHKVGRSQMFATRDLKKFKRTLKDVKRI